MDIKNFRTRIKILFFVVAALLMVVVVRLFYLQIVCGDEFIDMINNKLEWVEYEQPTRGTIYDSEGRILVQDVPRYNIAVIFNKLRPRTKRFSKEFAYDEDLKATMIKELSLVVGKSAEEVESVLEDAFEVAKKDHKGKTLKDAISMFDDVSFSAVESIRSYPDRFPGVVVVVENKRQFAEKLDPSVRRLIGYLGRIEKKQFDAIKSGGWKDDTYVGKQGLEAWYDEYLRGQPGRRSFSRSPTGEVAEEYYEEPTPGGDIYLTINTEYQKIAQNRLSDWCEARGKTGSVVLLDPRNGHVLALATYPTYNPEFISNPERFQEILADSRKPLLHRAYQEQYPLGSVMKIAVSVAGLEEKVVDESTPLTCLNHPPDDTRPHCHGVHGGETLINALKGSCNSYFAQLAKLVGNPKLTQWMKKLGFGGKTGIDLPSEVPGILGYPTSRRGFYFMGIGQGQFIAVTPLQAAVMVSTVASGGYMHRPRLGVMPEKGRGNSLLEKYYTREGLPFERNLEISEKTLKLIREGMWKVANEPGGTGYQQARPRFVEIGAKTGTAQISEYLRDNHSWYAGFAPFYKPELVFVVLVERGGYGSSAAGQIARDILDDIFSKRKFKE